MPRLLRTRYVIAYDVANDSERTKLSHLLLDYGDRVQKSVFEAELEPREVEELLTRAVNYLEGEDSLRLYPLCRNCANSIQSRGRPPLAKPQTWQIV